MAGPRQRARRNTPLGVETAVCQEWQRSSLIPKMCMCVCVCVCKAWWAKWMTGILKSSKH